MHDEAGREVMIEHENIGRLPRSERPEHLLQAEDACWSERGHVYRFRQGCAPLDEMAHGIEQGDDRPGEVPGGILSASVGDADRFSPYLVLPIAESGGRDGVADEREAIRSHDLLHERDHSPIEMVSIGDEIERDGLREQGPSDDAELAMMQRRQRVGKVRDVRGAALGGRFANLERGFAVTDRDAEAAPSHLLDERESAFDLRSERHHSNKGARWNVPREQILHVPRGAKRSEVAGPERSRSAGADKGSFQMQAEDGRSTRILILFRHIFGQGSAHARVLRRVCRHCRRQKARHSVLEQKARPPREVIGRRSEEIYARRAMNVQINHSRRYIAPLHVEAFIGRWERFIRCDVQDDPVLDEHPSRLLHSIRKQEATSVEQETSCGAHGCAILSRFPLKCHSVSDRRWVGERKRT